MHEPKIGATKRAEWANTTLVKGDAMRAVQELKRQGDGNIFVFGSGELCAQLMQHGLFDEYRFALAPFVQGSGKTLFGRGLSQLRMKLLEARPAPNGCVIPRYEPLQTSQAPPP
jgi:dihydrofolate reductase